MRRRLWPEVRNLIGAQLALQPHECGNEIDPARRFEQIAEMDKEALQHLRKDLMTIFGMNGSAPPVARLEENVGIWEQRLRLWLFQSIDEAEAATMIHDFLNGG